MDAGTNVSASTNTGDVSYIGTVNAGDSVSASTNEGDISYTGEVNAQEGSVTTNAVEGNISFEGIVDAGTNVSASTNTGDVSYSGTVNAGDSVSASTNAGDINYAGEVTAEDGSVTTTAEEGNISFEGSVDAGTNVNASTNTGDVSYSGIVNAEDSISVSTITGDVSYSGTVNAGDSVSAETESGSISYNGDVNAGQDVIAEVTEQGSIALDGNVNAAGNIDAFVKSGDITSDGALQAGQDITLRADTNGDITLNDSVTAGNNFTAVTDNTAAGKGNIVINSEVNAGKNIGLKTYVGDMQINDTVTSLDGTIGLVITGSGDIFQAEGKEGSLKAINGSVNVVNTGTGDVDLTEIYALDNARVGLVNGDLHLYEINGNLVAIVLRTEGKEMDVEHIVAAAQVIVRGSDMDLDDIEQRIDGEGMLVITPGGTAFDKPIDNFDIGNIETNGTSGIRIERLWVNNANVSTDEGKLFIDKLFVENKALFTNKGMVTSVYGTAPVWDGSNSVYWQNTAERRPEQNLNSWLLGPSGKNSGWMYLNFAENKGVQYSNGVLLHLQDHYYVYDQRFSGVEHLRYLNSDGLSRGYELEHIPGISYYNRYDNYELPEIVLPAAEDELIIE